MEFRIFEQLMKQNADRDAAWNLTKTVAKGASAAMGDISEDVQDPESAASTVVGLTSVRDGVADDEEYSDGEFFVDALERLTVCGKRFQLDLYINSFSRKTRSLHPLKVKTDLCLWKGIKNRCWTLCSSLISKYPHCSKTMSCYRKWDWHLKCCPLILPKQI
jgi:hypothetical protein